MQLAITTDKQTAVHTFLDRALEGVRRNIPVLPLLPRSKKTHLGAKAATLDADTVARWNKEQPDANCGFVAQAKLGGNWILDNDSPEVAKQFEKGTGRKFPRTFCVQSSKGGHRYFRQNAASISRLKNFSISVDDKEFFSVRWNNEYCVGPLSVHEDTGQIYKIVCDAEPIEAPDFVIDWLVDQERKNSPIQKSLADAEEPILKGYRDNTLTSIAGRMRHAALNEGEIYEVLCRKNEERCVPPLPDKDIARIARSIGSKPVGKDTFLTLNGKVAGRGVDVTTRASVAEVLEQLPKESPIANAQVDDMPSDILIGRLGDICQNRMNDFPLAYSWLSLVIHAGAFVPMGGPLSWRPNLLFAPVGPVRGGKSMAAMYAQRLLGMESNTPPLAGRGESQFFVCL